MSVYVKAVAIPVLVVIVTIIQTLVLIRRLVISNYQDRHACPFRPRAPNVFNHHYC